MASTGLFDMGMLAIYRHHRWFMGIVHLKGHAHAIVHTGLELENLRILGLIWRLAFRARGSRGAGSVL